MVAVCSVVASERTEGAERTRFRSMGMGESGLGRPFHGARGVKLRDTPAAGHVLRFPTRQFWGGSRLGTNFGQVTLQVTLLASSWAPLMPRDLQPTNLQPTLREVREICSEKTLHGRLRRVLCEL